MHNGFFLFVHTFFRSTHHDHEIKMLIWPVTLTKYDCNKTIDDLRKLPRRRVCEDYKINRKSQSQLKTRKTSPQGELSVGSFQIKCL